MDPGRSTSAFVYKEMGFFVAVFLCFIEDFFVPKCDRIIN